MHHPKTLALKRVKIKQTRANQKVGLRTGAIELLGDQRTLLKIFQEPPRNLNIDFNWFGFSVTWTDEWHVFLRA